MARPKGAGERWKDKYIQAQIRYDELKGMYEQKFGELQESFLPSTKDKKQETKIPQGKIEETNKTPIEELTPKQAKAPDTLKEKKLEIAKELKEPEKQKAKTKDDFKFQCPACQSLFDELDNGHCPNPNCKEELIATY